MKVPSCCRALDDPETCEHKDRYIAAWTHVRSRGFTVEHNFSEREKENAWLGGNCHIYWKPSGIVIWPTAFEHYGWDIITSVPIHQFGHCELYKAEGKGSDYDDELKANEYGACLMLPEVIPARYKEHRSFFLATHIKSVKKEELLERFEDWDGELFLEPWPRVTCLTGRYHR